MAYDYGSLHAAVSISGYGALKYDRLGCTIQSTMQLVVTAERPSYPIGWSVNDELERM
jgi:hypothetical protein